MRTYRENLDAIFFLNVAVMQVNIVMRNSGTFNGIAFYVARRIQHFGVRRGWVKPPSEDPVFKIQFVARIAIQYELADFTAMVLVPTMVSFFVWRDGFFSLAATGILIRPCDLGTVWLHFGVYLAIKPFFFAIARRLMMRRMALVVLGRGQSLYGESKVAAKIRQYQQRVMDRRGSKPEGGKRVFTRGRRGKRPSAAPSAPPASPAAG